MDEGTRGLAKAKGHAGHPDETNNPAPDARELEQQVDAIRDELGDLVGELDRRRHRAAKPMAVAGLALAAAGLTVAGVLVWRRRREAHRTLLALALEFLRTGHHGRHRA